MRCPVLLRACAIGLGGLLAACGGDDPTTTPEGGYEAFMVALVSPAPAASWDHLSAPVQELYVQAFDALTDTGEMVASFQPAERPVFAQRAGLAVLETVTEPSALYAHILHESAIPDAEAYARGARIDTVEIEGDVARIVTRAQQEVTVRRGADGQWRVEEPFLTLGQRALEPIMVNRTNLRDTVALFGGSSDRHRELERLGVVAPSNAEAGSGEGSGTR